MYRISETKLAQKLAWELIERQNGPGKHAGLPGAYILNVRM